MYVIVQVRDFEWACVCMRKISWLTFSLASLSPPFIIIAATLTQFHHIPNIVYRQCIGCCRRFIFWILPSRWYHTRCWSPATGIRSDVLLAMIFVCFLSWLVDWLGLFVCSLHLGLIFAMFHTNKLSFTDTLSFFLSPSISPSNALKISPFFSIRNWDFISSTEEVTRNVWWRGKSKKNKKFCR